MGDAEQDFQPSKKRAAMVQLSRDNPGLDDNEETSEPGDGTFKRASNEVLATRRIVKVRRHQTSSVPSIPAAGPASNPFAAIRLVPTPASAPQVEVKECNVTRQETEQLNKNDGECEDDSNELKINSTAEEEKTDSSSDHPQQSECKVDESLAEPETVEDKTDGVSDQDIEKSLVEKGNEGENPKKDTEDGIETKTRENEARMDPEGKINDEKKESREEATTKKVETSSFSSFQQLSSGQNAFSGLAGTGFSSTFFSFGSTPKDGSSLGSTTVSLFGLKNDQPSFGFGVSNNGNSSVFGASAPIVDNRSESSKSPSMQEVPVETGEENENSVFTADSILFEFAAGLWKERGKGELKVNVSATGSGKARLVMRARGNYRLILNAYLFPDMKLTNMDKKGITFACVNSAGEMKDSLSTIALKFKDAAIVEDFRAVITEHKANLHETQKTS